MGKRRWIARIWRADGLLEFDAHGVDGFERIVLEDFLADFVPEILLRIEVRRVGRKIQERDVVGNGKVAGAMVGSSRTGGMSCQANLRASTSRKAWKHSVFEVGMIR